MARTRRMDPDEMQGAVTLEPVADPMIDVDVSDDQETFEQFRESGDSETAGKVIWVYRVPTDAKNNPTGEDSRHLFSAPIDRYDLPQLYDRIKKEYMPRGYGVGTFRILVRTQGMRGVHWKKLLVLEKGAADDEPLPQIPEVKSGDPAVAALAEAMRQQNELLSRLFESRQNPQPQPDPLLQTERMLAMVATMTTAINGRPVAAVGAPQSLGDMAAGFREMLKLSREFSPDSGGGPDEEGIAGILKAAAPFADMIKSMIERQPVATIPQAQPQRRMLRREPPPGAPAAPVRQPTAEEATARAIMMGAGAQPSPPAMMPRQPAPSFETHVHHSPPPGDNAVLLKIVEMTNDLIQLKAGGGNPAVIGKTFAGIIPPNMEDQLLDLLEADDWFEKLCGFNPAVAAHREFFQLVRDSLLAEYEFSDDVPNGAAGAPGDAPLSS